MKTVFSTQNIERGRRFSAWQEAVCEHYLKVDVSSDDPANYVGFIEKSVLGPVILSDVFLSSQDIARTSRHIAQLDKECIYVMFPSRGSLFIEQWGRQKISTPGTAVLFDATEPCHLQCRDHCQSMCIEIPRSGLVERCSIDKLVRIGSMSFTDGLGWAIVTFCRLIASESDSLKQDTLTGVAEEIEDLLALYIDSELDSKPGGENLAGKFRLEQLKRYIDTRLDDPDLTPGVIARENGISLRYLYYIFKDNGTSVSEWIREQRLEKCHQKLTSVRYENDSITDIAFSMGFNSSSHFTRLFKQKFGLPPRSARQLLRGAGKSVCGSHKL